MRWLLCSLLVVVTTFAAMDAGALAGAEDWPAWRGPRGDGVVEKADPPLEWGREQNVRWKVKLPGPGNSTPIVVGDRVIITQAYEEGRQRAVIAFNRADGSEAWRSVVAWEKQERTHDTNPASAASPVSDGERIVAWHGSAGLFCYDLDGKELWRRDLGEFEHIWGFAASPVIYEDLVILNAGPGLNAFLVALNKQTGEEVWRKTPPETVSTKVDEFRGSWATPLLIREGDRDQLLVNLPLALRAFDPRTGDELWHCRGLSKLQYTSPVANQQLVIAMSGYHGPALACRRGGSGDVTETHRLWLHEQRLPQRVGSGVFVGEHFYMLNESGAAQCYEPATGKVLWEGRAGGKSWSSLAAVGNRIYAPLMNGDTVVLAANPEKLEIVATNRINEMTRASLAFSGGDVFQRSYEHLWCFGEK